MVQKNKGSVVVSYLWTPEIDKKKCGSSFRPLAIQLKKEITFIVNGLRDFNRFLVLYPSILNLSTSSYTVYDWRMKQWMIQRKK